MNYQSYYNQQMGKLEVREGETPFEAFERETLCKYYTQVMAYELLPVDTRTQWALENHPNHTNYTQLMHVIGRIERRDYINIIEDS